jgi:streptomycin 6-kinase
VTFAVPAGYPAQFDPADLAERADWLATLPALARRYATKWELRPDGDPSHGYVGVVWPVVRANGGAAMLKLSWPHDEARDEAVALAAWAGAGTVELFEHDADDYALLLERLDARHSLNEEPIDTAVDVICQVLRRLTVPAPPLHRSVRDQAATWVTALPARAAALGDPIPARLLAEAVDHCRTLGPAAGSLLVNEDLHYFNVLRGRREPWLLIDPKPIAGDPEFAVIPMLWNRYEETGGAQGIAARFDAIVRGAGLDRERARAWTLVRAVGNWLGALPGDGGFPFTHVLAEIAAAMGAAPGGAVCRFLPL